MRASAWRPTRRPRRRECAAGPVQRSSRCRAITPSPMHARPLCRIRGAISRQSGVLRAAAKALARVGVRVGNVGVRVGNVGVRVGDLAACLQLTGVRRARAAARCASVGVRPAAIAVVLQGAGARLWKPPGAFADDDTRRVNVVVAPANPTVRTANVAVVSANGVVAGADLVVEYRSVGVDTRFLAATRVIVGAGLRIHRCSFRQGSGGRRNLIVDHTITGVDPENAGVGRAHVGAAPWLRVVDGAIAAGGSAIIDACCTMRASPPRMLASIREMLVPVDHSLAPLRHRPRSILRTPRSKPVTPARAAMSCSR